MKREDSDFLRELLATFRVEAEEHVTALSGALLDLEVASEPDARSALVETAFREAHSLKGAARAVESSRVETICQAIESVLAAWKSGALQPSQGVFDVLSEGIDVLQTAVSDPDAVDETQAHALLGKLGNLTDRPHGATAIPTTEAVPRRQATPAAPTADAGPAEPSKPAVRRMSITEADRRTDTVRVSVERLDTLLLRAEELIAAKLAGEQRAADTRELSAMLAMWRKKWNRVRMSLSAADRGKPDDSGLIGLLTLTREFLDWNAKFMEGLAGQAGAMTTSAEEDHRAVAPLVDDLLEDVKRVLVLPFSSLVAVFPKMVRDIARAEGKSVDLVITGDDTEMDRRVIEQMKDPLIHIVRNAVDHGIEPPDVRAQRGKPVRGTIRLDVCHTDANRVTITVTDDGAGIDPQKLRQAGIKAGVLTKAQAAQLDDRQALRLLFDSGVSTTPIVTDMSGRGVGGAVALERVDKLGGSISIDSRLEEGTTFKVELPSTLATFRGIVVEASGREFVLPTANVDRVAYVHTGTVSLVEDVETVDIDGHITPLLRLETVLGLTIPDDAQTSDPFPVVVLGKRDDAVAFAVDGVQEEREVLVKSLGPQLRRVRLVTAATMLGGGRVVPILHVPDLLENANRAPHAGRMITGTDAERPAIRVIVAEDSITSRTLLRGVLEAAGYDVTTAANGAEALAALRGQPFDAVVSDVEMPQLDGFGLCSEIRSDDRLKYLPVILVTGLESREDRERGVEAGADAYIVKSGFDQNNLLDTIRRLT